ncbi:porin [Tenacibaculum sp. UWU-22]|uniref:porin n=1 Tax=Tenacibaculum sp. UWU-22 TaxID=3234187 RepID=UPI0034DAC0A4
MTTKFKKLLLVICLIVFYKTNAQEIHSPKFGKGIINIVAKDSTFSMKVGARMQLLTTAKWNYDNNSLLNSTSSMLVRRARLKFDGFAYSPKLTYKIELGLSNNDIGGSSEYTNNAPRIILDAVLKWNFYKNLSIWFGQTKLPGNRERLISSANLELVDRSLLNKNFNIDRDLGLQLHHHFKLFDEFIVKEAFSVAQGEGRNITSENLGGYQYTGKIEFLPFGKFLGKGDYSGGDLERQKKHKLAVAISCDFNNNAVKTKSNQGSYMTTTDDGFYKTNITTWFIDGMYKYDGFSLMGEYAHRNAKDPIAKNSDGTLTGQVVQVGSGLNLQSGYLFSKNWELTGRYTNIMFDKKIVNKSSENQYTLGISKYINGHSLKVQTDISYLDAQSAKNQLMTRLQVEIHF